MPDVHWGIGATVGSVIPTSGAIIPAAVGVDIGCGMMAVQTSLTASDLPDDLAPLRTAIERAVPHGRTASGGRGRPRRLGRPSPTRCPTPGATCARASSAIAEKHPKVRRAQQREPPRHARHRQPLHRGLPRRGGPRLVHAAHRLARRRQPDRHATSSSSRRRTCAALVINLPDEDLAYFPEGARHFDDYVEAVGWAQDFARTNRELMMRAVVGALRRAARPAAVQPPTSRR